MQGDWVIRTPCETSSRVFRLLERTFHRLHLLNLLDLRSSPTVLPSPLSHAVETWSSPSETHFVLQYDLFHKESHGLQICFWWRWRESNPRPTCLHFEGITTILFKHNYNISLCFCKAFYLVFRIGFNCSPIPTTQYKSLLCLSTNVQVPVEGFVNNLESSCDVSPF